MVDLLFLLEHVLGWELNHEYKYEMHSLFLKTDKTLKISPTHILKAQLSLASLFWAAIRSLAMMNSLKSRKPLPSVSRVLNT